MQSKAANSPPFDLPFRLLVHCPAFLDTPPLHTMCSGYTSILCLSSHAPKPSRELISESSSERNTQRCQDIASTMKRSGRYLSIQHVVSSRVKFWSQNMSSLQSLCCTKVASCPFPTLSHHLVHSYNVLPSSECPAMRQTHRKPLWTPRSHILRMLLS
jgi:hypothetical protein